MVPSGRSNMPSLRSRSDEMIAYPCAGPAASTDSSSKSRFPLSLSLFIPRNTMPSVPRFQAGRHHHHGRHRPCRYQQRPLCGAIMTTGTTPVPCPMFPADLLRLSSVGLRTRRLRAALSALGIAIGVAAIVAVLGLSASSQAGLLAEIDRLGTNMLTVSNGTTLFGQPAELPVQSPAMIGRIAGVTAVQDTSYVSGVN